MKNLFSGHYHEKPFQIGQLFTDKAVLQTYADNHVFEMRINLYRCKNVKVRMMIKCSGSSIK